MTFVCTPRDDGAYPEPPVELVEMPIGWPRPVDPAGLPVPYIARAIDDLGHVSAHRRLFVVVSRRCQVCGLPLGETAIVAVRLGDTVVIDGAAVHPERCWPLSLRKCPHLADLAAAGDLWQWEIPTADLVVVDASLVAKICGMDSGYQTPFTDPTHVVLEPREELAR